VETLTDTTTIAAPVDQVWAAIENPDRHAHWHPFVQQIDGDHHANSVRTCTVLIGTRRATTVERCTERLDGRKLGWRIESDTTGFSRMVSGWAAGFTIEPDGPDKTRVLAESVFTPAKLSAHVLRPILRRKFHQTQRTILASLKQYVEEAVTK
jgi:uncharacterized protein YndB with AHSA1/START domain